MMRIKIERSGLSAIGKRGFQEAGRLAIHAAGLAWWTKFLPLHFQQVAYLRYRYAGRDPRTSKLKREQKPWPFGENTAPAVGEVKPLVFTGRSRDLALAAPNIKAKAKNFETYRADVIINAPAFNFGRGKRIDMRDEVTRITPIETQHLETLFGREWNKQLRAKGLTLKRITRSAA